MPEITIDRPTATLYWYITDSEGNKGPLHSVDVTEGGIVPRVVEEAVKTVIKGRKQ